MSDSGADAGKRARHLRWDTFEQRIHQGPPSREVVPGEPRVELFVDPAGSRIGIRIFSTSSSLPPSPLAEIAIRRVEVDGSHATEVIASRAELFRDFYAFCCAVADRIQIEHQETATAIGATLRSWAALLRPISVLSTERQIGLLGELWFLRRLASVTGWAAGVESWRGPDAEEHDFTLLHCDVEVKSTLLERRVHIVGSLTQLQPKHGRNLFVVSVQLTPCSPVHDSRSLAEAVAETLDVVTKHAPDVVPALDQRLRGCGYVPEHSEYYDQPYRLRSIPVLAPVDREFPAIVPSSLASLGARLSRIESLAYRVNLEGLGIAENTLAFAEMLFVDKAGNKK